jgi:hypothetical protein
MWPIALAVGGLWGIVTGGLGVLCAVGYLKYKKAHA